MRTAAFIGAALRLGIDQPHQHRGRRDAGLRSPRGPAALHQQPLVLDGNWLSWLTTATIPKPVNDGTLGFVFTERPIYARRDGLHQGLRALEAQRSAPAACGPQELWPLGDQRRWADLCTPRQDLAAGRARGRADRSQPADGRAGGELLYEGDRATSSPTGGFRSKRIACRPSPCTCQAATACAMTCRLRCGRWRATTPAATSPISRSRGRSAAPHLYVPKTLPGFLFASSNQFARPQTEKADERRHLASRA